MIGTNGRRTTFATWIDLLMTLGVALFAGVPVLLLGDANALGQIQVPLGFILVFFLPGYAFVAAFYPTSPFKAETDGTAQEGRRTIPPSGPTALERLVIAIGLSIVVVPLVGLIWNFTPWGIAAPQVLGSLIAVVLVGCVVAVYRRITVSVTGRFRLPLAQLSTYRSALTGNATREITISVALALLVVVSVAAVGAAITAPQNGESYTELYLLSEDPESETFGAGNYPDTLDPGEPREMFVGIGNHESRSVSYTVVVELQRLESLDEKRAVVETTELNRFSTIVEPGEQTRISQKITTGSELNGQDLRLTFLLYKGEPPDDPSVANAYREVHIWVSIPSA